MFKEYYLENQLAMIDVVGQGGFGRVFKMKHAKTGILLAVKERVNNEEFHVNAWKKEINLLKMIEKKVPNLTTSRFIGTLDDSTSKINESHVPNSDTIEKNQPNTNLREKYILIEWIEGFLFIFFNF